MAASSRARARLRASAVVFLLAGAACGDSDVAGLTGFGETLPGTTTGDEAPGEVTFDPGSTGASSVGMDGDTTRGDTDASSTTDAPTTDAPTTDAPTTGNPSTSEGPGPLCGDGVIDAGEDCESEDLGGADCMSQGFVDGTLLCNADCTFDTSMCTTCGNGALEGGEVCDGAALGGASCQSEGFDGGMLGCAADCSLDTSGCTLVTCGNGVIEAGEACDGASLAGQTCVSQGFAGGGMLACGAGCGAFDTAGCIVGPMCGNGALEAGEACDGASLAGQTCLSQGFAGGGVLACAAGCGAFDTAGCIPGGVGDCCSSHGSPGCQDAVCEAAICAIGPYCCNTQWDDVCANAADMNAACQGAGGTCPPALVCGDGIVSAPEVCDGASLNGQTCVSQGFAGGGVLACNAGCNGFNTAGCIAGPVCGNGVINAPEVCDGANLNGQTCVSQGFAGGGVLACNGSCNGFNTAGCIAGPVCGNGVINAPEVCDGANLNGQTCVSQGFAGGGVLACAAGCNAFNTAGCIPGGGGCIDQDIGNATGAGVAAGNTAGSDDDINPSCGGAGGNDHVVEFTATAAGNYTFDTIGSGYDTKLALFSSCIAEISCNDDAVGLQSQLVLNMAAGQTILVVIDGFNGATGNFVLNITPPAGGGCAHPLCQSGAALANGCDPCVTQVCAADPFCCSTSWDAICVGEVTSICGIPCP